MKQKKLKFYGVLGLSIAAVSLVAAIVCTNTSRFFNVNAGEHSKDCVWNHYIAKDPTEYVPGNKEYWVCCADHEHVFVAPSADQGTITEEYRTLTDEQLKELAADDDRYIAPTGIASTIEAINNLPTFDVTADVFANAKYQVVLDQYNKLDEKYQAQVTNRDKLLEFNTYFECVISSSSMSAFEYTVNEDVFDVDYGSCKEFTSIKESGENFGFASLNANIDYTKFDYFTFAIYSPNSTTNWHFTNWSYYVDLINCEVKENNLSALPSTLAAGWNVITLSSADMKLMFCKDGTNPTNVDYGPFVTSNQGYGLKKGLSTMVTNFYGIKSAYYKAQAESVINKIKALETLDKSALTLWNGGQIFEARNSYDALPLFVQTYVTNLSTLEEYENAFKSVGTTYNCEWTTGCFETTYLTSFKATNSVSDGYFYTEISNPQASNSYPSFSPKSDKTISGGTAKLAIYATEATTIIVFGPVWNQTVKADKTNLSVGWNEIILTEIPDSYIASNICIAFNGYQTANMPSGFKLTPIYTVA